MRQSIFARVQGGDVPGNGQCGENESNGEDEYSESEGIPDEVDDRRRSRAACTSKGES
jgi:hypothetical protein